MGLKAHKKNAWIATALLLTVLSFWALVAVHDSAVAAARAARANKTNSPATCPFSSKIPEKKSTCCNSNTADDGEMKPQEVKKTVPTKESSNDFEKYANLNDKDLDEFLKQFTPEQLAKCPHLKARKTNKKK